jgi:two-component system KDP operon response regulator KdpE
VRPTGARVLLVDDEPAIVRAVRPILTHHGFRVEVATTAAAALAAHATRPPDLILLDLGLPDLDGLEVIRRVRAQGDTPVVVLSVRGAERDKVAALDLGADDFLTKPFGADELVARVRVALRHAARPRAGAAAVVRAGDLEIDMERRRVAVAGQEVHLSPTEYDLLKVLAQHPNKVLTSRMLLQRVWGAEYGAEDHYLHVYATRLRKKIEADPQAPRHLITEPGVGYRLLAD